MTDPTIKQEPDFWHRLGITTDGIYEGLINGVAAFGYAVDAVDNAPRILNLLPGEQGFSTISDGDPFMGQKHIQRSLTAAYNGYNDVIDYDVPQPVDLTDHVLHLGGEVAGGLAVAGSTHMAIQSSAAATNALKVTGAAATTIQETSVLGYAHDIGRTAWHGAWTIAKLPYQAIKLAFATAATGTAVVATGAAVDLGFNNGDISEMAVRKGAGFVAEKGGEIAGNILGIPDIGKAFNDVAPESVKEIFKDAMEYMGEHQELAKWGSFAVTLMVGNATLKAFLGDGLMGSVTSLAVASMLAWGISEMFEEKALAYAQAQKDETATITTDAVPAAPAPDMTM